MANARPISKENMIQRGESSSSHTFDQISSFFLKLCWQDKLYWFVHKVTNMSAFN